MFYQFSHLGSPDYFKLEKGRDFSFPPHLHQCFEVITLLSGEMEVVVEEQTYRLAPGQAILIFPNQIHSLQSERSEHLLCIFSPRLVQAFATRVAGRIPKENRFSPDSYLLEQLAGLEACGLAERKGILYLLCGQFEREAVYYARPADGEKLLWKIFSFVEREFAGECSLAAVAASIGYDYSYLSRYFKRTVGISFNAYVNHYRLSHACYLMENTDFPILRCAMESGYDSLRSFNRNFKNSLGLTPAEYRKSKKM
ncbi:MAG: AraC family transcriptional regulator [Clostridia bacterium]|nr:AraC family transcriptional regulator [Clostridia bacterium]